MTSLIKNYRAVAIRLTALLHRQGFANKNMGSSSAHLVLPLLRLAEGNVLLRCLLVETSPAVLALGKLVHPHCLQHLPFFLGGLVVIVAGLLYACPQLQGFGLPLGDLLFGLLLLELLVDHLPSLYQLLLLVGDQPLLLRVELLPLLLEDLPAHGLVLGNAIGVELPPAPLPALDQLGRVILFDLNPVLSVYFLYVPLLEITPSLPVILPLRLLSLHGRPSLIALLLLLLVVTPLIGGFVVLLVTPLRLVLIFGIVLLHLIVDVLV